MTCTKRKYSKMGALFAITRAQHTLYNGKKKKSKIPTRSYYCKFCGYYHLTSQKKRGIIV